MSMEKDHPSSPNDFRRLDFFFRDVSLHPDLAAYWDSQSDGSDGSDPTKDTGAADLLLFMLLFVFLGMALAAC